jgi:polysaccharide export outer membrane protein
MKGNVFFVVVLYLFLGTASCMAAESDYLVGPGDVLKVTVYDNPDLSATVRVDNDGTINFPLVGTLQVEGLSVSQVGGRVADSLANGYIVNPQVSVFVEEFRSWQVYVTGQVKKPDAYKLERGTSVIKAITMAGGFTELAAEGRVKLIRKSGGTEQVLKKVPMHMIVLPEDIIVVPESFF